MEGIMDRAELVALPEEKQKERVLYVFSLYGTGDLIDGNDVMDAMRALNMNPTIGLVCSLGGSKKRGETFLSFEELWKIFCNIRDNTDEGGFVDFVECLKIYDIGENGKMKLEDLTHMLLSLGEPVTVEELDIVLGDCMQEEEDDDGWIPYLPFLCRLCDKPVPKSIIPQ